MATHTFQPKTYYSTLGAHPVALTIADGDTVVTTTVDASGVDLNGEQRSSDGNPMTGPFAVDGAEPGDELVVRFNRMWPNRDWGWTRSVVATNVIEPDAVMRLPEMRITRWQVDVAAGTATLPDWAGPGRALTLPLDPMVGCLGVAAQGGQAISTATSNRHGGNMDYRGIREGVSISFPVFEPGGLFFLGDGHATQGCGEIVGTGIEISFDVEFTVTLRKGSAIAWPRIETAAELIAVGNARPLDQALQHATTELIAWLEQDYGLGIEAASALLGQCISYDVANVFNPAYSVAARIAKDVLPTRS